MKSPLTRTLFFATALLFTATATYSQAGEPSIVAIAPDKTLCPGSDGSFIPLPAAGSADASVASMVAAVEREFGKNCRFNGLLLSGRISEYTLPQFRVGLELLRARPNTDSVATNTLWLDSPGGLIAEAMKIGNLAAENNMDAIVVFKGRCYSSCVLVYAAARTRGGFGDVGIHRPFAGEISATSTTYAEYLKSYEGLTPVLKQYFAQYGVSPSLVDAMNVVPSDEIKVLARDELESYGLGFQNIAAKEYEKARTIQMCGQAYYDLHIRFHSFIEYCRERFGISVLDQGESDCWALAHEAFPSYSDDFDACKAKKSSVAVRHGSAR